MQGNVRKEVYIALQVQLALFFSQNLQQNCKERADPKVLRFVEPLYEGIKATNTPCYLRSKHNFVLIQTNHSKGAHGEISGLRNVCSTNKLR